MPPARRPLDSDSDSDSDSDDLLRQQLSQIANEASASLGLPVAAATPASPRPTPSITSPATPAASAASPASPPESPAASGLAVVAHTCEHPITLNEGDRVRIFRDKIVFYLAAPSRGSAVTPGQRNGPRDAAALARLRAKPSIRQAIYGAEGGDALDGADAEASHSGSSRRPNRDNMSLHEEREMKRHLSKRYLHLMDQVFGESRVAFEAGRVLPAAPACPPVLCGFQLLAREDASPPYCEAAVKRTDRPAGALAAPPASKRSRKASTSTPLATASKKPAPVAISNLNSDSDSDSDVSDSEHQRRLALLGTVAVCASDIRKSALSLQ
ncbi:hypothetical protein H696_01108 [Fonticula alba]|uniref:Uncharacterized protein n=1 Tax=Fonticula alba TaxID=691883 RepID=A0A058ZBB0_FONAL|nr:hypothetical protein H696_01108 [Fonticula alba]KCV71684.1 hypothetical protein H696_01108 [Fonticula alba]|eukprot:XP_009493262.1 hypothetical protein H696_01108 [Fonticula alba]